MEPSEFLARIAERCPAYAAHLDDCPLNPLRAAAGTGGCGEKIAAMPDAEVDDLIRRHFLCLCRRDGCEIH